MIFLSGFGAISISALFCINRSLKLAPASVVVPYQYTLIVWGVLFGWRLFSEVPDVLMLIGAAIIVASGLYIFWREQIAARDRLRAAALNRNPMTASRATPRTRSPALG